MIGGQPLSSDRRLQVLIGRLVLLRAAVLARIIVPDDDVCGFGRCRGGLAWWGGDGHDLHALVGCEEGRGGGGTSTSQSSSADDEDDASSSS